MNATKTLLVLAIGLAIIPTAIHAKTVKGKKQMVAGFIGQVLCASARYDYSEQEIKERMQVLGMVKGKEYEVYLKDPIVIQAGYLMSQSMSPNCTKYITNGSAWRKANDYMKNNGL